MDTMLLATKLRVPPAPQHAIPRTRLIDTLEGGVHLHKLTLLAAPAGYGKTSLLTHWAHTSQLALAWLSISAEDSEDERFFRYLLHAWAQTRPEIGGSSLGLLLESLMPDREAVLAAFLNAAAEDPDHMVFVLDDYHLIANPSIHQALSFLLDHAPPNLHLVLACRDEPPLPLARYRARRELLELHAADLRFERGETAELLSRQAGVNLDADQIATLDAQLEGWAAGLQLASLSLQQGLVDADRLAITGKNRFVADYLSQDVLAPLPSNIRQFLLQTSILERMSAAVCDAVTDGDGSQAMLEQLERDNLFVQPLDDRREWFRYHPLFADVLQAELQRRSPAQVQELHRRAAQWHLEHDLPDPALRHAVAGSQIETAIEVFNATVQVKLNTGELQQVRRWLDMLPPEWRSQHAVFGIAESGWLAFTGNLEGCIRCIDDVEARLQHATGKQEREQLGKVLAVRCAIACMQDDVPRAETFADQALRDLAPNDAFRGMVYGALGDAYRRNGLWPQALRCYHQLLDMPPNAINRYHLVHVFGALADLALQQGRLRDAADFWGRALAGFDQPFNFGRFPLPLLGWVSIRMGETLYEWNQLDAAAEHLAMGLKRAELGGDVRSQLVGYLLAGRLKLAQGDAEAASRELERARTLIDNAAFPDWIGRFERLQLECWLAQDRLRAAVQWSDQRLRDDGDGAQSEERTLALARVMIVKGDAPSVEQAHAVLQQLLATVTATGRQGIEIEALALLALASDRHGDRAGALTCLERALRLAEPEGYLRLFADLGLPMARLLQAARSRSVMPDYVDQLLGAYNGVAASPTAMSSLPEPLTEREQEILAMLAAGLTNREIAEQLVISPETVKKHTSSIFGKLGVGNRTEAATRARELDLLS